MQACACEVNNRSVMKHQPKKIKQRKTTRTPHNILSQISTQACQILSPMHSDLRRIIVLPTVKLTQTT